MPFSERKGRFLVTTACCQPVSLGAAAIPPVSASNSDQRVLKRKHGRFTVSTCQAYASSSTSPPVEDTQAAQSDAAVQLSRDHRTDSFSSMSSGERDASPFAVADQQQHHQGCDLSMSSWDSSSSLCSKGSSSSCATAKQAAATPTHRVRFSEPDCCTAAPATPARYCGTHSNSSSSPSAVLATQAAVLQASAAAGACDSSSRGAAMQQQQQQQHYLISPTGSVPRPMMRSYCRGRFMVQEAVLFANLPRSMSVPEHSCSLEQFVQDNAAAAAAPAAQGDQQGLLRHSSGSSDASSSSDACNSHSTGCQHARLLHQQQQQQQEAALAQAVVAAAAAADSFWAAASAAQLGDSSTLGCTLSDDFAVFSSAAAAAAAAAAVGMPSRACRPHHHPPKRSQTVSYFRRGRFLVQTTYT